MAGGLNVARDTQDTLQKISENEVDQTIEEDEKFGKDIEEEDINVQANNGSFKDYDH